MTLSFVPTVHSQCFQSIKPCQFEAWVTGFSRCLRGTRRSFFDRSSHPTQLHSYSTKGCSLTCNLSTFMAMNVSSVTGVLHQSPHGAMSSDLLVCGEVLLFWFGVPSKRSVIFRIWDCLAGYFQIVITLQCFSHSDPFIHPLSVWDRVLYCIDRVRAPARFDLYFSPGPLFNQVCFWSIFFHSHPHSRSVVSTQPSLSVSLASNPPPPLRGPCLSCLI